MTTFEDYARAAHTNSVNKGFYEEYDLAKFKDQAAKLCLVTSEVSETMEALRKEQGSQKVVEEIADILIRTFDFYDALLEAGVVTESLTEVYDAKATKNKARPHMHGVLG